MTKLETCLKDRSLEDEAEVTYKYAISNLNIKSDSKNDNDNNDTSITNIIKVQREKNYSNQLKTIEDLKNNSNTQKKIYINNNRINKAKLDMINNMIHLDKEIEEIKNSGSNNSEIKKELHDKLFKINELIKEKQQQIEKINDDLKANQGLVLKDEKKNKTILILNIVFFSLAIIILLYINLSSSVKYKTRRNLSKLKGKVISNKNERFFNSNNNNKKTEGLYNNNNMKKQKKMLGLEKENDK